MINGLFYWILQSLHVYRFVIQAFADDSTRPEYTRLRLRELQSRRFHFGRCMPTDLPRISMPLALVQMWLSLRHIDQLYEIYRCLLYHKILGPPLFADNQRRDIASLQLCRRFHFADDQRRDIASFIMQTVSLRRWSTARYCDLLNIQTVSLRRWSTVRFPICIILRIFNQTDCDIHMKKAVLYIETIV